MSVWAPPDYRHWHHFSDYYLAGLEFWHAHMKANGLYMVPVTPDRSADLDQVSTLTAMARVRARIGEAMHFYAIKEDRPGVRKFHASPPIIITL